MPAFNEERLLAQSLRSIREAMRAFAEIGWESELIVCDNNSSDATAVIAREEGARVVFEPINQISRARNRGASVATGSWLIFVDADSHPSQALFAAAASEIIKGRCLAGGSTVRLDLVRPVPRMLVGFWNCASRTLRWCAGSFIFCETAAFKAVGGFSEELFASEEIDLSQKLKRLGKKGGRRVVILHAHPLVTSARKFHLYSRTTHLKVFLRALLRPGSLKNPATCELWYDGRR